MPKRYVHVAVTILSRPERVVAAGLTADSALKAGRLAAGREVLSTRRILVEQAVYEEIAALEEPKRRSK